MTPEPCVTEAAPILRDPAPGGLRLDFPAEPLAVRAALRAALARFLRRITEEEAGTLELVLAEVLNNIVEHAFAGRAPGRIELSLHRDASGLSARIADDGAPMPGGCPPETVPPCAPLDADGRILPPEGGFGWPLIRDLTEGLRYRREAGRNVLTFRLPLAPR